MQRTLAFYAASLSVLICAITGAGQTLGNSGTIQGTVLDPSGAVLPGATVTIQNPVSEYTRSMRSARLVFPLPVGP